ncbi:hypothetical protein CEB3_c16920 [Peptococcaceae bacterium CEB3]|nr:hypothetical protein CEB3_c16920 [Peptococcaceae bacterium CEB3]
MLEWQLILTDYPVSIIRGGELGTLPQEWYTKKWHAVYQKSIVFGKVELYNQVKELNELKELEKSDSPIYTYQI